MTEQRTPDALSTQAENELICEKLFGWKKRGCFSPYDGRFMGYDFLDGERPTTAPSFTTWAEAGLIAKALRSRGVAFDIHSTGDGGWLVRPAQRDADRLGYLRLGDYMAMELPEAIRAAALEYIKAVKS